jgi:hypothetical protein
MTDEQKKEIFSWVDKDIDSGGLCISFSNKKIYLLKEKEWETQVKNIAIYSPSVGSSTSRGVFLYNLTHGESDFPLPYENLKNCKVTEMSYAEYEHLKTMIFRKIYLKVDLSFVNPNLHNLLFLSKNELILSYCEERKIWSSSGMFLNRLKKYIKEMKHKNLSGDCISCLTGRYIPYIGRRGTLYGVKDRFSDIPIFLFLGNRQNWFVFVNKNTAYVLKNPEAEAYFNSLRDNYNERT